MNLTIHEIDAPEHRIYTDERIAKLMVDESLLLESIHLRKNGTKLYSSINCKKIKFNDQDAILCNCRNIDDHKKNELLIEEKNNELQKLNSEKDKFFSIIAHDLKSPFNAIIGLTDLLKMSVDENNLDEIKEYTDMIIQSSNKATNLLKNLMDWSRSQTGRIAFIPANIDMVGLINETIALYTDIAAQKSITIIKELPATLPVVADKDMLATVLRNLISNAIKFTRPEGEIKISAQLLQDEIQVKISDNGVGIPKIGIEKLFQISSKYSTSGTNNEQGTGLGLILCKDFIDKHHGKIWVESVEDKGSDFVFTLPVNK